MCHILRVEPYSMAEDRLNELIAITNNKDKVIIKEKESYIEYEFDNDVYMDIRTHLIKEREIGRL